MAAAFYGRDTTKPSDNNEPYYQIGVKVAIWKKSPLGTAGAAAPEYATDKDTGMIENRDLNILVDIFDNIDPV